MKRIIITLFFSGISGIAIGVALGIFIYPYWFLNDIANEQLQMPARQISLSNGVFIHAQPNDPVHWGKGRVRLYRDNNGKTVVFLDKDFEVGPGPRFHVYLADNAAIRNNDDFKTAKSLDLGRLRAFRGSQIYRVPAGTDVAAYQSVVIWCKEFGVLISPATLANLKTSALTPVHFEG